MTETFKQLRGKVLTALGLGLAIMLILSLSSDLRQVGGSFRGFRWLDLPLVLGLTALNYLLRWLKWDYYLRQLRLGPGVSRRESALIFTAGMVMAVTPGKVGEVFKAYLLRQINGTPISKSAPIVLVERLTDGLAMLLLMGLGLTLYPPARLAFLALVLLSGLGIAILQTEPLFDQLLSWFARLPFGQRLAPRLRTMYASAKTLLAWRILLLSTLLSFISWGFECWAFFAILTGLHVAGSGLLFLQATFIFAASTLFGLVSLLPGGLGTSEVSSTGLLMALVGLESSVATTATIMIRFCTLWFGVALGLLALGWFKHRHGGSAFSAPEKAEKLEER